MPLKYHQMEAVEEIIASLILAHNHFLAHKMGLGKTRVTCLVLQYLYSVMRLTLPPSLIVTTSAGQAVWLAEILRWTNLKVFLQW